MNETLTTLIDTVGIVGTVGVLGLLAFITDRSRRHIRAARYQVENEHPTNLRDELDARHAELIRRLEELAEMLEGQAKDIRGLRRDGGRHSDQLIAHEKRLHEIETQYPKG